MVQARQHVVPQSKQPKSASSFGTPCPHPHRPSIGASVGERESRVSLALTVPRPTRVGKLIVFIGPIKFLDQKYLSQVGIIEPYRVGGGHKRGEWVEIGQVEAFLAVGTFGGFRRAADALRVTQPAISARIRALEQSLGVPLFVRSQTGLSLSAAGRAFRPHAEQLLHAVALARQAVHDLRPASGSALQIAAALSICTYVLPDVLKRFQAAHPKVMITVRSGHSKEVLEMVLGGQAEIGLARSLQHPEVETLSLRDDPLVLVARPDSQVARARRVRLEDVAGQPLVFFDRGSSDWTLTHGLFRRAGLVPNVVLEVETIETAKRMVERGMGLAFLPHLAVVNEIRRRRLVGLELSDAEPLSRSLDVIHPRQRPLSHEALALLKTLRAAVGEEAEAPRRRARKVER
jgi:DNA-binding transcriptional LysR family regulator